MSSAPRSKKLKKYHRIRAHRNPLSDWSEEVPLKPEAVDWSQLYPIAEGQASPVVEFADVGCGYGGLTVALGLKFPDTYIVGMEIRSPVVAWVKERFEKLRAESAAEGTHLHRNIGVMMTNAMKFLPNYFRKGQLKKIFFLFPDPHFKKCTYRRRIISTTLLSDYAYVLAEGGLLYTVTDVKDLYDWETETLDAHPMFQRVPLTDLETDPCIDLVLNSSEEARKVDKSQGQKWIAVYRRIAIDHSDPTADTVDMDRPGAGDVKET